MINWLKKQNAEGVSNFELLTLILLFTIIILVITSLLIWCR